MNRTRHVPEDRRPGPDAPGRERPGPAHAVPEYGRSDAAPEYGRHDATLGHERPGPARTAPDLVPGRLGWADLLRVGGSGLRTRPGRVLLSALGIAIGIATMVAVVGISSSSKAQLLDELDRLGTDLLTVTAGRTVLGGSAELPEEAVAMAARIGPVTGAAATGDTGEHVWRTDMVPREQTGGLGVRAASPGLLTTLQTRVERGVWLNRATGAQRAVVLGSVAAQRLGVREVGDQVWIGGRWWTVTGVLAASPLAPEIDRSVLVGSEAAGRYLDFDGHPTTLYIRSSDAAVGEVRQVLPRTVNPEHPEEVEVSRPSDGLVAKAAAAGAFTDLLLGVGAMALLVGGVGVANTMVISVLERRGEIGLRRSLGATRGQVRGQFLTESLLLSGMGGAAGVALGALVTVGYAAVRDLPAVVPLWAMAGGLAAPLLVGTVAGIYPAMRAARMSPTLALTTP
ncbi:MULTISPECIES: ABC transporter permease [Streptosporangium]|uniref:ABC transport system permease protein n=1 Tax=Streptosporangium brasiliense TaxID=47480 RepID=A0ABT9RAU2_9ACTN|nr:ABC transporter permease [Streptosporangium brasiliense]MDP9866382.1 putative ABC transport system permease protein [Streptosporangium brasiliense]